MRTCSRCKQSKDESEYNRKQNGLDTFCRSCRRDYSQEHYRANKAAYQKRRVSNRRGQRERLREVVREAKEKPCMDCGGKYPHFVMQFDHRPGEVKTGDIANLVNQPVTLAVLKIEMSRCDVVCANCHAIRTFSRV